jgi:hypothetical protein
MTSILRQAGSSTSNFLLIQLVIATEQKLYQKYKPTLVQKCGENKLD